MKLVVSGSLAAGGVVVTGLDVFRGIRRRFRPAQVVGVFVADMLHFTGCVEIELGVVKGGGFEGTADEDQFAFLTAVRRLNNSEVGP